MRVNKQIAALALSAVMGTAVFSAMPVMAAGTVQSAEASSSQEQSKVRKGPEDRISELVENGTISKETGEKISNYMKENRPEKKEKASGTEKPEKKEKTSGTESTSGTEKKEKKQKTAADSADSTTGTTENTGHAGTGKGNGRGHGFLSQEFLDKLLADKVITQEEYDALKAAIPERPEKPADGENGQTRQKGTKQKKNTTTNTTTGTT